MNTRSVEKTQIKKQWDFPQTTETGRIFTKHFTNLSPTLPTNQVTLLSFLIYQSNFDNSFKYSTKLLHQYRKWVDLLQDKYGKKKIGRSWITAQKNFKILIENGLLLRSHEKIYIINPNLTFYNRYVNPRFYKEWTKNPNIQVWIEHVKNNVK